MDVDQAGTRGWHQRFTVKSSGWLRWISGGGSRLHISVPAVLLLPGLVLSLGAGAVFGLQLGLVAVWAGATLGETLAFLLGRYLGPISCSKYCSSLTCD